MFRRREGAASKELQNYFREIFFEAPWRDASLPSLVCEEAGRGVVGFLGVMPRRMMFRRQPIKVAVVTQLMVADEARATYTAAKLMKRFLAGAQDLSFSDGANEASERLWQGAGGSVALLYSLEWTRVLRPAEHAALLLKRRRSLIPVASALWPLCQAADAALARGRLGRWLRRYWLSDASDTVVEHEPPVETLLWCVRHLAGNRALQPEYQLEHFRWLLAQADEKKIHGSLRKGVVRDSGGQIIGWYLYYARPGAVAQVLQFGGRPKSVPRILDRLFLQAWKDGAVAVSGELEPRYARQLAGSRCVFTWPGFWPGCLVLAHSGNRDLLNAIHQGDALLTRLEGEWWARFSDPGWILDQPSAGARFGGVAHLRQAEVR